MRRKGWPPSLKQAHLICRYQPRRQLCCWTQLHQQSAAASNAPSSVSSVLTASSPSSPSSSSFRAADVRVCRRSRLRKEVVLPASSCFRPIGIPSTRSLPQSAARAKEESRRRGNGARRSGARPLHLMFCGPKNSQPPPSSSNPRAVLFSHPASFLGSASSPSPPLPPCFSVNILSGVH